MGIFKNKRERERNSEKPKKPPLDGLKSLIYADPWQLTVQLILAQSMLPRERKMYLRGRVEGVPCDVTWEVCMSVMHTDRVDLFFVTFDTMRCSNVISEDPSLCSF